MLMNRTPPSSRSGDRVRFFCGLKIGIFALFVLCAPPSYGDENALTTSQESFQQLQKSLKESQSKRAELQQTENDLQTEITKLQTKLIKATKAYDEGSDKLNDIQKSLTDLRGTAQRKSQELTQRRQELGKTFFLLQRLALEPPALQMLAPTPPLDRLHVRLQLRALLPQLKQKSDELAHMIADMTLLQKTLKTREKEARAQNAIMATQQKELDRLITQRSNDQRQTHQANLAEAQRLNLIAQKASTLQDLIEKLEAEQKAAAVTQSKIALANKNVIDRLNHRAPPSPSIDPKQPLPVRGTIAVVFGQKDATGIVSKGITITARQGMPVRALMGGKVAFAGPFRGYGRLLILEHEQGFHSIMAGMESLNVTLGQKVAAGEPVGKMSDAASPPPELYYEIRENGVSIDPLGKRAFLITASP